MPGKKLVRGAIRYTERMRWPARMAWSFGVAAVLFVAVDAGAKGGRGPDPSESQKREDPAIGRPADAAEAQFRRDREYGARPPGSNFPFFYVPGPPGMPFVPPLLLSPNSQTREGKVGWDDLHLVPDGSGGYRGSRPGYRFAISRDGRIDFKPEPAFAPKFIWYVGFFWSFDIVDIIERVRNRDVYWYDQALVLKLTDPLRERLRDEVAAEDRRQALKDAMKRLAGIWSRTDMSDLEKRRVIFALWDETEEGASLRGEIVRYVQTELPRGSGRDYPADEIARLNRERTSQAPFSPYDEPHGVRPVSPGVAADNR